MNTVKLIILIGLCFAVSGCGEEFAAGLGTGMVAMKKMSDSAQDEFIEAVNNLNAETTEINAKIEAVKNIKVEDFVKPETIEVIKSLKGREKDPAVWIALASIIANGIWAGRTIEKRKKANKTPTS